MNDISITILVLFAVIVIAFIQAVLMERIFLGPRIKNRRKIYMSDLQLANGINQFFVFVTTETHLNMHDTEERIVKIEGPVELLNLDHANSIAANMMRGTEDDIKAFPLSIPDRQRMFVVKYADRAWKDEFMANLKSVGDGIDPGKTKMTDD